MKSKTICALIALSSSLSALEVQPWFCDVYEFDLTTSYAYSRFNTVQGGVPQLTSPFNVNVAQVGLEFSPAPEWSLDAEAQVADTSAVSFNFRSGAFQVRYLWLDDIVGDSISFDTGFSTRATSSRSLRDISCPSHGNVDFELNFSLGKELDTSDNWRWRLWGFGAVGHANRGSPWVRAILAIETKLQEIHKLGLYAWGSNGYGRHSHLSTTNFYGYGKIRQKSIDLSLSYSCQIGVWGTLRFDVARRVLAKVCPQNVTTGAISFIFPFSF